LGPIPNPQSPIFQGKLKEYTSRLELNNYFINNKNIYFIMFSFFNYSKINGKRRQNIKNMDKSLPILSG
jgi:hypothetical protein